MLLKRIVMLSGNIQDLSLNSYNPDVLLTEQDRHRTAPYRTSSSLAQTFPSSSLLLGKSMFMSHQLLKGKKGIIFGALDEKSIAWKTALKCYEEGAQIVLTNAPVALRMGEINKLAEACGNAPVIGADVTNMDDLKNLFEKSMEHFGGKVDFVLHSIGMSLNVRKGKHYTELNYEWNAKTLDISAMSLHRVLRTAWDMDAINDWGSVVALTYIAAQRVFPDYNEMADAKSLLESVTRSFGYHYAVKKKVRVNTISQSPTRTTAGSGVKGFDGFRIVRLNHWFFEVLLQQITFVL